MSGSNQAVRLQGMLTSIADSFNGMGDAYNFVPNAIRNVTRPEVDMDNSKSLLNYSQWAQRNGYEDEAAQYSTMSYNAADRERETEEKLAIQRGRADISDIRRKMTGLYDDPTLSVQERNAKIDAYQEQINEIAGSTAGMNPNDYALVSQNVDTYYTERKRNEAADNLALRKVEIDEERLGLAKDQNAMAQQRHRQLMESGELELENAEITQQINRLSLASQVAKAYVGQEGGKEAFLSAEGMADYGGLFDAAQLEYDTQQANRDLAVANAAEDDGFNYTQEELEEMLYLMPDPEKSAKELLKNAEKGPPSFAHNRLMTMLEGQSAGNKLPEATLLKMFDNMASARVEAEKANKSLGTKAYSDSDAWWSEEEDKARAMGLVTAAMLDAYMTASSPAQGIRDVQMILTYGIYDTMKNAGDTPPAGTKPAPTSSSDVDVTDEAQVLSVDLTSATAAN